MQVKSLKIIPIFSIFLLILVTLFCQSFILHLFPLNASAAELYIWVDEKGVKHITDQPPEKPVKLIGKETSKPDSPEEILQFQRSKGISMHMLPKRVADLNGQKWGFLVSSTEYLKPEQEKPILQNTEEFLIYVRKQDKIVQENGVWIVITNPAAYSKEELTLLENIKALCKNEMITLFVARGSQLPKGWVRY